MSLKNITIDPEFCDLIPPLQTEELEQLHKSLSASGCYTPLIVWKGEGVLVDGHNRYQYCQQRGIEFQTVEMRFSSREVVKNWIILNQLGRRNVSADMAATLRGMLYNGRKKEQGGTGANQHAQKDQNDTSANTAEQVAAETGVSPATVKRDGKLVDALGKLGISEQDFMSGKVLDASGKRRSKKSIIEEAFPPKPKVAPPPAADDEEDEVEVLVIDESKAGPKTTKAESCWTMATNFIASLRPLKAWQERQALADVIHYCRERIGELDKLNGKEKPEVTASPPAADDNKLSPAEAARLAELEGRIERAIKANPSLANKAT
jgi:hypothetical protein